MKLSGIILSALIFALSQSALANSIQTEKWITKNGVRVVFYQAMEVPMLDISLAFAAGSAYDKNHYGLSALTTQMLDQGNAGQDANNIAEQLANTGAQFDMETSRDMVILNLRTLTSQNAYAQATKTLAAIINHPDFPEAAFENEKKQLLMAIEQTEESPDDIAGLNFFNMLYQGHPYAHPVNGTKETVSAITQQHVVDFYKQYFVTNNAVLVIVGAIDKQQAQQLAEQLTQDLPKGQQAPLVPKATQLAKAEQVNIQYPSSQTVVRLGQMGIDHHNPDFFPLMVGNYILGGGSLVSRLAIEVREKRGLTYGVSSQFSPMPGEGPFLISLSTRNDQAGKALAITQNTLNQFINNGPDSEEIKAAKQFITGSFPLSLSGNRAIATLLLRMNFYHLPDNYLDTYNKRINAVTPEQIKQAFKRQINPEKLLLVTVGQS